MTIVSAANRTYCQSDNCLGAETSSNNTNCSCTDSFPNDVTRLVTKNDHSKAESNATVIKIVTMNNSSSPNGATTVVPPDATQNTTSSIDLGATTTNYPGNAKKIARSWILSNCLKQSPKDVARPKKVFEIIKNKIKSGEHATRKDNEIDGRNRTDVIRITPPINEFWRYVTFPTRAPLIGNVTSIYRMRGLSRFKTVPRKSQKRVKFMRVNNMNYLTYDSNDSNKNA